MLSPRVASDLEFENIPALVSSVGNVTLPPIWKPLLRITDLHPAYHDVFVKATYNIMYGIGNLSHSLRHFIATMAATRHRCHFLVDLHTREFERLGGDRKWLRGLSHIEDKRIEPLDLLNRVLAHQPWLCSATIITELVRSSDSSASWSLTDLVHAAVILSHTHALASFIHAVGSITPAAVSKTELHNIATRFEWAARDKENNGSKRGEVEDLLNKMARLQAAPDSTNAERNAINFLALAESSSVEGSGSESPDRSCDSPIFSNSLSFAYVDFADRIDKNLTRTFKSHEFTWEHGFSILEDLSGDLAISIDNKFKETQALTYGFMGGFDNVDTTGYRLAIWNYIQALFGIRHDDYDYAAVNQLLSREMKTFVKTVACFPHRLTDELRSAVMTEFKPSEKVHVVMMIMESRLQASMLWFTRTLTNYYALTNRSQSTRQLD